MTITNEIQEIINAIEHTKDTLYITGKAGTGKTTLLRHLTNKLGDKAVVTASTGIAAVNAGGVTLHSFFGIPLGVQNPDEDIPLTHCGRNIETIKKMDVLIIDEVSMVRPDMIDYIDQKLKICKECEEPFGGVQVIMFGDLYQLPPVVKAEDKKILFKYYEGYYFFYSRVLSEFGFRVFELTHVFRQTDEKFIKILNNMRSYNLTEDDIEELAERRDKGVSETFDNKKIHICSLRREAEKINTDLLGAYTHSFQANVTGNFNINSAPCEPVLNLRVGARVMTTTNNNMNGYYNGSLGIIEEITNNEIKVRLDYGFTVNVAKAEWENHEYVVKDGKITREVIGKCIQFPLMLAWAITIHKSQGLTFDDVVIHAKSIFAPGQTYVALSRCRTLEGIVIDTFISKRHVVPDAEIQKFTEIVESNNGFYKQQEQNEYES